MSGRSRVLQRRRHPGAGRRGARQARLVSLHGRLRPNLNAVVNLNRGRRGALRVTGVYCHANNFVPPALQ
jgi:hypothetical protein